MGGINEDVCVLTDGKSVSQGLSLMTDPCKMALSHLDEWASLLFTHVLCNNGFCLFHLKGEDGLPGEDGRKVCGVVRSIHKMLLTKCSKFDACVRPSVLCPVCRVTKEKQEHPEETSVKLILL